MEPGTIVPNSSRSCGLAHLQPGEMKLLYNLSLSWQICLCPVSRVASTRGQRMGSGIQKDSAYLGPRSSFQGHIIQMTPQKPLTPAKTLILTTPTAGHFPLGDQHLSESLLSPSIGGFVVLIPSSTCSPSGPRCSVNWTCLSPASALKSSPNFDRW